MKKLALLALIAASLSGCTALGIPYQTEACAIAKWANAACDAQAWGEPIPVPPPEVEAVLVESVKAAQITRAARTSPR